MVRYERGEMREVVVVLAVTTCTLWCGCDAGQPCAPLETRPCACGGGQSGTQVCITSGNTWTVCDCDGGGDGGVGDSGPSGCESHADCTTCCVDESGALECAAEVDRCSGEPAVVTQTVEREGGVVIVGGVSIDIPEGALEEPVELTVELSFIDEGQPQIGIEPEVELSLAATVTMTAPVWSPATEGYVTYPVEDGPAIADLILNGSTTSFDTTILGTMAATAYGARWPESGGQRYHVHRNPCEVAGCTGDSGSSACQCNQAVRSCLVDARDAVAGYDAVSRSTPCREHRSDDEAYLVTPEVHTALNILRGLVRLDLEWEGSYDLWLNGAYDSSGCVHSAESPHSAGRAVDLDLCRYNTPEGPCEKISNDPVLLDDLAELANYVFTRTAEELADGYIDEWASANSYPYTAGMVPRARLLPRTWGQVENDHVHAALTVFGEEGCGLTSTGILIAYDLPAGGEQGPCSVPSEAPDVLIAGECVSSCPSGRTHAGLCPGSSDVQCCAASDEEPLQLEVGGSTQLAVIVSYTNLSSRDVTEVAYISADACESEGIASVSFGGQLTGLEEGTCEVQADYEEHTVILQIEVTGEGSGCDPVCESDECGWCSEGSACVEFSDGTADCTDTCEGGAGECGFSAECIPMAFEMVCVPYSYRCPGPPSYCCEDGTGMCDDGECCPGHCCCGLGCIGVDDYCPPMC